MPDLFDGNLSSYDDAQLRCRTGQHAWIGEHWNPVPVIGKSVPAWERTMTCHACGADKLTKFSPTLEQGKSKIYYADGYLTSRGNKFDKTEYRRERINRVVGKPRLSVVQSS